MSERKDSLSDKCPAGMLKGLQGRQWLTILLVVVLVGGFIGFVFKSPAAAGNLLWVILIFT